MTKLLLSPMASGLLAASQVTVMVFSRRPVKLRPGKTMNGSLSSRGRIFGQEEDPNDKDGHHDKQDPGYIDS